MPEHNGFSGLPSSEYDRFPKPGDVMVFRGEGGYDLQIEEAKKVFEVGEELVVEQCAVRAWDHSIWFEGHEGWFNGVMFERAPARPKVQWTDEQVRKLNEFQACGHMHPFTCPGEGDCPSRELIATNEGWVCACGGYTQDWAHPMMFEGAPPNPFAHVFGEADPKSTDNDGEQA